MHELPTLVPFASSGSFSCSNAQSGAYLLQLCAGDRTIQKVSRLERRGRICVVRDELIRRHAHFSPSRKAPPREQKMFKFDNPRRKNSCSTDIFAFVLPLPLAKAAGSFCFFSFFSSLLPLVSSSSTSLTDQNPTGPSIDFLASSLSFVIAFL
jgi:hypothetical protein